MIPNIDTIYIIFDIEGYPNSCKNLIEFLNESKKKAQLLSSNKANITHNITISDKTFNILSNGSKSYAFIIKNSDYEIKISEYRNKIKNFYPIQVRISSELLWSKGLSTAYGDIYNWIVETFNNIIDTKITRVDLCCHVDNVDFMKNYEETYKGTFKKRTLYEIGRRISGLDFGKRGSNNIFCRIYDKSLEVKEQRKKTWFYEIWTQNNMDINNVWNVEFEIDSQFLRNYGIYTVSHLKEQLFNIWNYCTTKFIVKIDRINKRVDRCPINDKWQEIQHAYDKFKNDKPFIEREKQKYYDAENLIPSIAGNMTSYLAKSTNVNSEELFFKVQQYYKRKGTTFEKAIEEKKKL